MEKLNIGCVPFSAAGTSAIFPIPLLFFPDMAAFSVSNTLKV